MAFTAPAFTWYESSPWPALLPLLLLLLPLLLLLLLQDVPACIDYVLKHSPCQAGKLHWIGHSMVSRMADCD